MSGIEIWVMGFLQAALLTVVGFLWRSVTDMCKNEIQHIHDRIERFESNALDRLKRIEDKLDIHIDWHKKRGDAGV